MSRYGIYDVLYMLKPVREVEPGWWKLRWRPIWKHTFSAYRSRWAPRWLGFKVWRSDANNGWGRSYSHLYIRAGLFFWTWEAWVRWAFIVMADGPSDAEPRRPIQIPTTDRSERR